MYLDLFKLKELPFRLSPDPEFLYLSKNHARAKTYMESTIWFTDGFVVITGEIGAGKTTLIETFLKEITTDVAIAQVNQTQVSVIEFLQSVLVQFGFSPFKMKKAELMSTLNDFLVEQYASGRKVLLIVDEAQNLPVRVLEEIRLLSGVETTKEKVLRIILCGQPELNATLDSPELVQLRQRIRLRFHLGLLSREELQDYIEHRLAVAGAESRQIFEPETYDQIFRYTGGTPRLINTLCDTAMMAAFAEERDVVTSADVAAAVGELRWSPFVAKPVASSNLSIRPNATGGVPVARVLVSVDGESVAEVPLCPGRTIIGRTPDNDVQIDNRFVSRHHCQILTTADGSVIEDLNSTNGITIKGKRVHRHHLNDGDVVGIGRHELTYVDERAPGSRDYIETIPGVQPADAGDV